MHFGSGPKCINLYVSHEAADARLAQSAALPFRGLWLFTQCGSDSFLQVLVLQNPHQPVTHIQKSAREPSILLSGSSRNISSNFFGFKLQSSGRGCHSGPGYP